MTDEKFPKIRIFFSSVYMTIQPALSIYLAIGPSICRSVCPSNYFFGIYGRLLYSLLLKCIVSFFHHCLCLLERDLGSLVSSMIKFTYLVKFKKSIIPAQKRHYLLKLPHIKNGKLYFSPSFPKVELCNSTFFQQCNMFTTPITSRAFAEYRLIKRCFNDDGR